MFTYIEESRCVWFNSSSLESEKEFELVGILLGLAIYNGIILDVHFPLVIYKKLQGEMLGLQDLMNIQPSLAKSLQQLLDFEGDAEDTFCYTFQVMLNKCKKDLKLNTSRVFSHVLTVTFNIHLVSQNNEMASILAFQTNSVRAELNFNTQCFQVSRLEFQVLSIEFRDA